MESREVENVRSVTSLRVFGLQFAGLIGLGVGWIAPWLFGFDRPVWPWFVAAVIAALSLLAPWALKPLNYLLLALSSTLGKFNSIVLLTVFYFVILCPMGLVMRIVGKNKMRQGFDPALVSYRRVSERPSDMEKPF